MDTRGSSSSRMAVLLACMLAMALAAMDSTIVATAIPTIVRDLGGFSLFPWVFSIYLLTQAAMVPIYGKLADLFGRKPVLMAGTGIFIAGSVFSGLAWNMLALIVFRGFQGIGAAAIIPITSTIVGDLFTLEERAKMQGYLSSVWGLSAVIGPAIGGFFVQYASWRWVFYINLPIGLAALLMLGGYLHESVSRQAHRLDYEGAFLLMAAIGCLITALLEGGVHWKWTSPASILLLAAGLVGLALFVGQERRAPEPVLPLWVFRQRAISAANTASLGIGILTIGLSSYLPTFVQGVLERSPLVAGFALGMMSIGWPLASSLSGRLYLTVGFRATALIGSAVTILGSLGFVLLSPESSPWQAGLASFVMGCGLGLGSTSLLVSIQSVVAWNRRGMVTGSNMFMRQLGSAIGVAGYGGLVNARLSAAFHHPPATVASRLPHNLNAAGLALGRLASMPEAVSRYIRLALAGAIHRVFWGVFLVAAMTFLIEWALPQHLRKKRVPDPDRLRP
ncbi:major facilitator superfamily MFS_1 [Sulfobacillus acidophilus DSM 10332]|uniref:Major facilitator superfamily MFS_1 n=1 Tax=Sulfobacillus acidophilus (strain ATCC 700253 / DSM 10332 / NAL) TaxID=679936 RepID=G8TS42_SULAD|nr:major facilitator superfamily MFS_1 [Sulfobacillus acidophilus DSM 10332]